MEKISLYFFVSKDINLFIIIQKNVRERVFFNKFTLQQITSGHHDTICRMTTLYISAIYAIYPLPDDPYGPPDDRTVYKGHLYDPYPYASTPSNPRNRFLIFQ